MKKIVIIVLLALCAGCAEEDPCHGFPTCQDYEQHLQWKRGVQENERRLEESNRYFEAHEEEIRQQVNELNQRLRQNKQQPPPEGD